VFNFYSSTEDVLRVDDEIGLIDLIVSGFVMKVIPTGFNGNGTYAWQIQEMYKGLDQIPHINAPGGGISKYAGWGFVKKDSQHIEPRWAGLLGHAPVKPFVVSNALDQANSSRTDYLASLQSDPLFRQDPEELFQAGALAFASGTVGAEGGSLDYNVGDIGGGWDANSNFDMSDPDLQKTLMTDPGNWFEEDQEFQGRPAWHHSDFRHAPYVHVYKLFEKITGKEN